MSNFTDMTKQEQRFRIAATVPSIEEYFEYRLGSSAVGIMLAVNE